MRSLDARDRNFRAGVGGVDGKRDSTPFEVGWVVVKDDHALETVAEDFVQAEFEVVLVALPPVLEIDRSVNLYSGKLWNSRLLAKVEHLTLPLAQ